MNDLRGALVDHLLTAARIREAYPDLAEDDPAFIDTLEGASTLPERLATSVRSSDEDEMLAEMLKRRIEQMVGRRQRLEARAVRKRELVAETMQEAGLKRLVVDDLTISLSAGSPKVVVSDEQAVPEVFWNTKITRTLDKRAIGEALKAARPVPGCTLSNAPPHLIVRRS